MGTESAPQPWPGVRKGLLVLARGGVGWRETISVHLYVPRSMLGTHKWTGHGLFWSGSFSSTRPRICISINSLFPLNYTGLTSTITPLKYEAHFENSPHLSSPVLHTCQLDPTGGRRRPGTAGADPKPALPFPCVFARNSSKEMVAFCFLKSGSTGVVISGTNALEVLIVLAQLLWRC